MGGCEFSIELVTSSSDSISASISASSSFSISLRWVVAYKWFPGPSVSMSVPSCTTCQRLSAYSPPPIQKKKQVGDT